MRCRHAATGCRLNLGRFSRGWQPAMSGPAEPDRGIRVSDFGGFRGGRAGGWPGQGGLDAVAGATEERAGDRQQGVASGDVARSACRRFSFRLRRLDGRSPGGCPRRAARLGPPTVSPGQTAGEAVGRAACESRLTKLADRYKFRQRKMLRAFSAVGGSNQTATYLCCQSLATCRVCS
jgi:hypothetical protein